MSPSIRVIQRPQTTNHTTHVVHTRITRSGFRTHNLVQPGQMEGADKRTLAPELNPPANNLCLSYDRTVINGRRYVNTNVF